MVGHNSSSCTSPPLRGDLGHLRPWGEDVPQHVGDLGWESEVWGSLHLPVVDVAPRERIMEPPGCVGEGDPKDSQNCDHAISTQVKAGP